MAGGFVKIDIEENSGKVSQLLERLVDRAGDLRPVFDDIGEYLLIAHDERFAEQQSPKGDPWAPLSEKYRQRKKRNKDKILVLEDFLAGTLRYQVTAKSLLFGTDRIYGATHQFGDEKRNIAARPFLGLSAEDDSQVVRLIGEHIMG